MVERSAVNRMVVGSSPTRGAKGITEELRTLYHACELASSLDRGCPSVLIGV